MSTTVRARRAKLRRSILQIAVVALVVFGVGRLVLPRVVQVRGGAMAPSVQAGDWILTRTFRGEPVREAVVLVESPFPIRSTFARLSARVTRLAAADERARPSFRDRTVVRRIVALPGDRVTYDERAIVVSTPGGETFSYRRDLIDPVFDSRLRSRIIPAESVFVIAERAGYADSRQIGVISISSITRVATGVLWPAVRRGDL